MRKEDLIEKLQDEFKWRSVGDDPASLRVACVNDAAVNVKLLKRCGARVVIDVFAVNHATEVWHRLQRFLIGWTPDGCTEDEQRIASDADLGNGGKLIARYDLQMDWERSVIQTADIGKIQRAAISACRRIS